MTVVAWDGSTLAADRLMVAGETKQHTLKLFRGPDWSRLAITGNLSVARELVLWFQQGAVPDQYPPSNRKLDEGASLIVVDRHGLVRKYESSPFGFDVIGRFCAFGCGAEAALAAMHCGKTAAEAVEIASLYNANCGGGVDTLE